MAIKFEDAPGPKGKPPGKAAEKAGRPSPEEKTSETAPSETALPHAKAGPKAKKAKFGRKP